MFRRRKLEPTITAKSEVDRILGELRNIRNELLAQRADQPIIYTDRQGKYVKHYDPKGSGVTIERIS